MVINNIFLHNIAWSRYRRDLFAEISESCADVIAFKVIQMAENESGRKSFVHESVSDCRYSEKIISNKFYEKIGLLEYIKLIYVLLLTNYDVLTVSGYGSIESWIALIVTKIKRKKIVVAVDSWEETQSDIVKRLKIVFLKLSSAALSYGTRSRAMLMELGMEESLIFYPFHNVSKDFYNLPIAHNHNDNLEKEPFVFAFAGRLSKEKSVEELVHAFDEFNSSHCYNQEFMLLIAGSGILHSQISKLLSVRGLESKVKMLGALGTEDLIKLYQNSRCLVLPSVYEPWGLVVNEALCCGCPVLVSSNCGCIDELCTNSEFSLVFNIQGGNLKDNICKALHEAYCKFSSISVTQINNARELGNKFSPSSAASVYRDAITTVCKL